MDALTRSPPGVKKKLKQPPPSSPRFSAFLSRMPRCLYSPIHRLSQAVCAFVSFGKKSLCAGSATQKNSGVPKRPGAPRGPAISHILLSFAVACFAAYWLSGDLCLCLPFLAFPFLSRWGAPWGVFACYLCLLGTVSCSKGPSHLNLPTIGDIAAVIEGLLVAVSSPCYPQNATRDKLVAGLTVSRLAIRCLSSASRDPLLSLFWFSSLCLWLLGHAGPPAAAGEGTKEKSQPQGFCSSSMCGHYLHLVTELTEGGVTICDSECRILWACPYTADEHWNPSGECVGGPPTCGSEQAWRTLRDDHVHPDDWPAFLRAFNFAKESKIKKLATKEDTQTETTNTSEENESSKRNLPAVLVRIKSPPTRGGTLRLYRVSITYCKITDRFACLWRDATRLRRIAAMQEALVYGLSDCMSTAIWVFDPIAPQEAATEPTSFTADEPAPKIEVAAPPPFADSIETHGEETKAASAQKERGRAPAGSKGTSGRQHHTCHSTSCCSWCCTSCCCGKSDRQQDEITEVTVPSECCSSSHLKPAAHLSSGQRPQSTPKQQDFLRPPDPRLREGALNSISSGSNCNTARQRSPNQLHSPFLSLTAASASGSFEASDTNTNVAPASLCPSVYQADASVNSEKIERTSLPRPASENLPGANLHGSAGQFTVVGGAPMLQIEKEGPRGFVLEHSKAILQRLTGRTVLGSEPFSSLSSGDDRSPERRESSWTDFFLEPGKTQLLECVSRLRTKGTSFSMELPYERSDGTIRWFRVAGYCSAYAPGVMWGIMQDTTASRTRLGCAQRSLHQLQTLFEAEFCGLGIVDTADTGLIVETSGGLDDFLGASAVGRPSICLLPEPVEKLTSLRGSCVGAPVIIQPREFPHAALHQVTVTAVLDSESPGDLIFALRDDRRKESIRGLQNIIHAMDSS